MDRISLKSPVSMRENYVDIIKGFAIIAVVLLHINFAFPKYALINTGSILEHHFTTPNIDTNITLLIGYLFFGIGIPLLIRLTFKIRWSRHLHFREM